MVFQRPFGAGDRAGTVAHPHHTAILAGHGFSSLITPSKSQPQIGFGVG